MKSSIPLTETMLKNTYVQVENIRNSCWKFNKIAFFGSKMLINVTISLPPSIHFSTDLFTHVWWTCVCVDFVELCSCIGVRMCLNGITWNKCARAKSPNKKMCQRHRAFQKCPCIIISSMRGIFNAREQTLANLYTDRMEINWYYVLNGVRCVQWTPCRLFNAVLPHLAV